MVIIKMSHKQRTWMALVNWDSPHKQHKSSNTSCCLILLSPDTKTFSVFLWSVITNKHANQCLDNLQMCSYPSKSGILAVFSFSVDDSILPLWSSKARRWVWCGAFPTWSPSHYLSPTGQGRGRKWQYLWVQTTGSSLTHHHPSKTDLSLGNLFIANSNRLGWWDTKTQRTLVLKHPLPKCSVFSLYSQVLHPSQNHLLPTVAREWRGQSMAAPPHNYPLCQGGFCPHRSQCGPQLCCLWGCFSRSCLSPAPKLLSQRTPSARLSPVEAAGILSPAPSPRPTPSTGAHDPHQPTWP